MRVSLLIWISLVLFAYGNERTWTSDDGKQIVGEIIRDAGDAVVLMVNGKEFTVPLARLSAADREWIDTHRKELEARRKEYEAIAGSTKTYPKNDSQPVTFHVYYPSSFTPDKKMPMLILFSASARGGMILERFTESCEAMGWIGVGCDTFRNGRPDEEMDPLFEALLPIIETTVPHDPQRLYMGGISGGAARALHYTARFDRPWKGIISCGGWLARLHDLDYHKRMAVAWVNGDQDNAANSWVERDSDVLKSRSCKTKLFHFPGGHVIGPPETLTEAMRWVEENTR